MSSHFEGLNWDEGAPRGKYPHTEADQEFSNLLSERYDDEEDCFAEKDELMELGRHFGKPVIKAELAVNVVSKLPA